MGRYQDVMEHVAVTLEMRERVLKNVAAAGQAPEENDQLAARRESMRRSRIVRYSRLAVAAVAALMVLGIGVRVWQGFGQRTALSGQQGAEGETVASPFETYTSAAELAFATGVPIADLTELPFSPASAEYTSIDGALAQITYTSDSGEQIIFRGQKGSEDPSGDYSEYSEVSEATVGDSTVTLKGADGKVQLTIWSDGGYTYSLSSSEGFPADTMIHLIKSTMQ